LPDTLDLGSLTTPDGHFLVREAPTAPFVAGSDGEAVYQHRFTYRGSDTSIKKAAIELIRGARRKIFLASFRIGDRDLLDALFAAVDRLHGGVYIITSWTESSMRRDLSSIEDVDDIDIATQKKQFDALTRRGIALRGHEDCHAKFLVVDDTAALVSSANLETSALADTPRRLATGESGVVFTNPTEAGRLARFFTRLWYSGCTWEALPGTEYALRRREPSASPIPPPKLADGPGVIWTHGNGADSERGILGALHDVIARAERELLLATFSLDGIRERPELLLNPLRRAMANRDLDVRLLVRSRNHLSAHRADATALADLGVTIHGDSKTHAKAAIADGRHGALFSANFDASHGLFGDVEVGVRLDGQPALTEARRYLHHAMAHADLTFASRPTQRELDRRLGAAWRQPWPYGDRIPVVASEAHWQALCSAATSGPVLWEDSGGIRIHATELTATLHAGGSGRYELTTERAAMDASSRLQSWYDTRTRAGESKSKRGCCPAVLTRGGP
jgi:phosphatidylserine/phosphatidylglycerophosphate/cardiolipin synthase-like enzyme